MATTAIDPSRLEACIEHGPLADLNCHVLNRDLARVV
jgi:hypothetical protein